MLEKTFEPLKCEQDIYKEWEKGGHFKPTGSGDNFSVVIPPPNVTGNLHMGHALNNTMQDIIVRYKRMTGNNTVWVPGTDHAGIATQMVVERLLDKDGVKRHDLGREKFLDKVWEWKEHSGGQIVHQQRRLGNSTDWDKERFTMDEGLSKAVLKVFVQLYEEGLIYRDKRLVNWDPKLETAISDLEVIQTEVDGHMWYFNYPVVGMDGVNITVGTTRPETMLGDTGVAVHPSDERYTDLVGKKCIQPLTGKEIPIVADEYPDPEQGTGAVKMTPAHDFNDFEVGKRQNLEVINIMTKQGKMNENCPEKYIGMDRFDAREAVVKDMDEKGYLVKIEDYPHTIPYGDRGGVPIEPYLTDQWYVDAKTLAKPAIEAVETGRTKIVPENWTKTYYEWMNNIQPWCISRQLWWGHQIPAWFHEDGSIFVSETEAGAYEQAKAKYGDDVVLKRDDDVLDTWFSSALWPFSTLGWPDKTPDLENFYQNDILVTGFDILFFWVARMMMFGIHFMGKEPFHTVIVHALVLDEHGAKMSKSKGNVIDPLLMADAYGADTLRFTLASLATPGKDIKFSTSRVEGTKSLMTKIWNAAKFCEMNLAYPVEDFDISHPTHPTNRWIIGELNKATKDFEKAVSNYRFSECASVVYQFVRGIFCDWYVEFSKPLYWSDDEKLIYETRTTMGYVFKNILKLIHPIIPFVSEQLWKEFGDKDKMLISSGWIDIDERKVDTGALSEMDWVRRLISEIRKTRAEMNIPAGNEITIKFQSIDEVKWNYLNNNIDLIKKLAKVGGMDKTDTAIDGSAQFLIDEATVFIPLDGAIDITAEVARLEKVLKKAEGEAKKFGGKLSSQGYLDQAPEHIIEKDKASLAEAENIIEKTKQAIAKLKG
ncbi:MAG: valine--tRNA ligase [Alphaproteobacteria bacterium]